MCCQQGKLSGSMEQAIMRSRLMEEIIPSTSSSGLTQMDGYIFSTYGEASQIARLGLSLFAISSQSGGLANGLRNLDRYGLQSGLSSSGERTNDGPTRIVGNSHPDTTKA